uniref:Uncharacterized protein n=1 Tax=Oryza rufipogon TaxID=4529 RepID=A0A0E0NCE3_ORYRU
MGAYMVTHGRPHVARVLCHLQVENIPPRYVLKRYPRSSRRDTTKIYIKEVHKKCQAMVVFDEHDYRRFGLTTQARYTASKSMQSYDRTMEVLKELDINGMSREQLLNNEKSKQAEHKQPKDYSKSNSMLWSVHLWSIGLVIVEQ